MNRRSLRQSQMPDTEHRKRRRNGKDTVIISICRRRYVKRQNDTGIKEASDCITWIPDRPDVFLYGSYDVWMAGSGIYERQSCDDGTVTDASDDCSHGDQPEVFISGFKGLIHRAPNMDTLVALGSGASFVYSTYALFAMTDAQMHGDMDAVMSYMHDFILNQQL